MYFRGVLAMLFVILLVTASGCTILSGTPKAASTRGSAGTGYAVMEPPSLPEQYTAKGAQSGGTGTPARFSPVVTMQTLKPVLKSAQHQELNGSGLEMYGSYTETVEQIVTYLTENQDYNNQTVITNETSFWNAVAFYVKKKIDPENPVTASFATSHVHWSHNGSYSADQVSDIWDYVMPPRWVYVNDTADGDSPFGDHFSAASESIANGFRGDCDDFAILNAATTAVLGGKSRVVYATDGSSAHMYAEAQFVNDSFVNSTKARYATTDQIWYHPVYWLNLDWFNWPATATHPGGRFYGNTDKIWVMYKDGTWEKQQKSGSNWTVVLSGP